MLVEDDKKLCLCNKRRKLMYIKPLKIGNIELENNIFLAPMAGITDLPFRKIYKRFGMRTSIYRNGKFKSASL